MKKATITQSRQIELLEKYFPVDAENKIVTIKIHYDNATDLLDFSVGDLKCELFNNEVLEKITDITNKLPIDYQADVVFVIDDYNEYDPTLLMEKLEDSIEINNFTILRERKKNWIISALLVLVGFVLLFFLGVCREYNLFGDGLKKEILEEMLDITSWVFIWQAVTVMFLTRSDLAIISTKLIMKLNSLAFYDKDDKELIKETKANIVKNWDIESKASNFKKAALLIVSTIITALGISELASSVIYLISAGNVYYFIINIVFSGLVLFTGVVGLYAYKGANIAKRIMFPISIILFIFAIFCIIGLFYTENYGSLFRGFVTTVVVMVYGVVGILQMIELRKKK